MAASSDEETGAVLRRLEERLLLADVRRSAAAVAPLLADDFVEVGSSGRRFGKGEILASLATEPETRRTLHDFAARELGPGLVLVTYRAVRLDSDAAPRHSLRSSIWHRTADGWQMLFHQGTPCASPAGADDRSQQAR